MKPAIGNAVKPQKIRRSLASMLSQKKKKDYFPKMSAMKPIPKRKRPPYIVKGETNDKRSAVLMSIVDGRLFITSKVPQNKIQPMIINLRLVLMFLTKRKIVLFFQKQKKGS